MKESATHQCQPTERVDFHLVACSDSLCLTYLAMFSGYYHLFFFN